MIPLTASRHFWDLLMGMTEKELRARYKRTAFGFLWIFVNPVIQMLVIGFIFQFILPQTIEHYYFLLFAGLLVWNFFSLSLTKATPSIVFERALIKKARFPRVVIPLSIVLSNFFHFVLALGLLLIAVYVAGILTHQIFWLIPAALWLISFAAGCSLLTSALNVKFRDINFFVLALLIIWFYATPVIYTLNLIPSSVHFLWSLNPLTGIIQLMQHALTGAQWPSENILVANLLITLGTILVGIGIFSHESKHFDDWV